MAQTATILGEVDSCRLVTPTQVQIGPLLDGSVRLISATAPIRFAGKITLRIHTHVSVCMWHTLTHKLHTLNCAQKEKSGEIM